MVKRIVLAVLLALCLPACRDRALEQRAAEIRALSEREDRMYAAQAIAQIRHRYWTVHGNSWYGKLPDGSILRLDDPRPILAPLPSRAFYRGWHLQVTLAAGAQRTYPPGAPASTYAPVYAVTRETSTAWNIRVTNYQLTTPIRHDDALLIPDADTPLSH